MRESGDSCQAFFLTAGAHFVTSDKLLIQSGADQIAQLVYEWALSVGFMVEISN